MMKHVMFVCKKNSAWVTREVFEDWQLDDPAEQPEIFPRVRAEVRERVVQLINSLETVPVV
ncbi:MAG TPA: hypothetical protein V6C57_03160 [Coleofasciculaceae cyanobacterium]